AVETHLVRIETHPVVIPQLAIHLDKNVNEQGLTLNKQEHLAALAALDLPLDKKGKTHYLETLLKEQFKLDEILSSELFLYPLEPAALVGLHNQLLSSYRIDNLGSSYAAFQSFLRSKSHRDQLSLVVFWDNEEIGSQTSQGAHSPFLPQ